MTNNELLTVLNAVNRFEESVSRPPPNPSCDVDWWELNGEEDFDDVPF